LDIHPHFYAVFHVKTTIPSSELHPLKPAALHTTVAEINRINYYLTFYLGQIIAVLCVPNSKKKKPKRLPDYPTHGPRFEPETSQRRQQY